MKINHDLLENGTGIAGADNLITSVRQGMGKGPLLGRRVHNCIAGDAIELRDRKTGAISWGVVVIPQVIVIYGDYTSVRTKLCAIREKNEVKLWR